MDANDQGKQVLSRSVSASTYRGLPLLLLCEDGAVLSAGDFRFQAVAQFALSLAYPSAAHPPPLIGISTAELSSVATMATIDAGLRDLSKFEDSAHTHKSLWSDGRSRVETLPCGPILAVSLLTNTISAVSNAAWNTLSPRYTRSGKQGLFKIGSYAVGHGDPEGLTGPPVYPMVGSTCVTYLEKLLQVWRGFVSPVVADYAFIQAADSLRRGLSKRTAPALAGYARLAD